MFFTATIHAQIVSCQPQITQIFRPNNCADSFNYGRGISIKDALLAIGQSTSDGGAFQIYRLDQDRNWIKEAAFSAGLPGVLSSLGFSSAFYRQQRLAVGNPGLSSRIHDAGAVYVYDVDGNGVWSQSALIEGDDSVEFDYFGRSLAWITSGSVTRLLIAASKLDSTEGPGSVYLYKESSPGQWQEIERYFEPVGPRNGDFFGYSVDSVEGNGAAIVAVGAKHSDNVVGDPGGHLYLYHYDSVGDSLVEEADFQAPQSSFGTDSFGIDVSVGLVNDIPGVTHRAAVGRLDESDLTYNRLNYGAVYLYLRRSDGTWYLEDHLVSPMKPRDRSYFGWSVDLDERDASRLLIGAKDDDELGFESGAAFLFERNSKAGLWEATNGLFAPDGDSFDTLGAPVVLGDLSSSRLAVVGATGTQCPGFSNFQLSGAAYSFDLDPTDGGALPCPPPLLKIIGGPDCARSRPGDLEVRWFNASPGTNTKIALLLSRALGSQVIPPSYACAGTSLGLANNHLQIAYTGPAGTFGATSLKSRVPASICNSYIQLLDISSCQSSNVVQIQ